MNLPFGNGSLLKKKTFWVFGMSVRGCSPDFHNGASNGVLCLIRITARCPVVSPPRHSSDVPVGRWPVAQRFERQRAKKLKNIGKTDDAMRTAAVAEVGARFGLVRRSCASLKKM